MCRIMVDRKRDPWRCPIGFPFAAEHNDGTLWPVSSMPQARAEICAANTARYLTRDKRHGGREQYSHVSIPGCKLSPGEAGGTRPEGPQAVFLWQKPRACARGEELGAKCKLWHNENAANPCARGPLTPSKGPRAGHFVAYAYFLPPFSFRHFVAYRKTVKALIYQGFHGFVGTSKKCILWQCHKTAFFRDFHFVA